MKLRNGLLALMLIPCISQTASVDELKNAYSNRFKKLRSLLLSIPGNRQSAEHIVTLQKQIRQIEDNNGITELSEAIGKLRLEACLIQNKNPQAKKTLSQIKKIVKHLEKITESDRNEINRLTKLKDGNNNSDNEKAALEAKIKALDKKMREKTKPFTQKLNDLNLDLRDIPEIRKKINAVAPLSKQVREKYERLNAQLDPLDKEMSKYFKEIHQRLGPKKQQLKKLRLDINKLRKFIVAKDPCFVARENLRPIRWERYLA
jgi:DNA repair exonuclease SbcCD ATPase subunit